MATGTDYISLQDLDKFQQILEKVNPSNAEAAAIREIRKIIGNAMRKAKKEAEQAVGASIPNNQRHAEKAVRAMAYSRKSGVLGGILTTLRGNITAGGSSRALPELKGGGEPNWSDRTKQLWGYTGTDAQFLLYWLAVGTADRQAGVGRRDKKTGEYGTKSTSSARQKFFGGVHNVGRISPNTANYNLTAILDRIVSSDVIQQINEVFNKMNR